MRSTSPFRRRDQTSLAGTLAGVLEFVFTSVLVIVGLAMGAAATYAVAKLYRQDAA